MMPSRIITYKKEKIASNAKYCNNFFSAFRGLMFSKKIGSEQALIIERKKNSITDSAIHMLFVFQKLKIVWLDSNKKIVDIKLALPFVSFLFPKKPAKYIVELNPDNNLLKNIKEGDCLEF